MIPTLLFLALLASISTSVSSTNPGLQIRFAQSGIDKAAQLIIDQLSRNLQGRRVPDISGVTSGVRYTASRMTITRFTKPASRVTLSAGSGMSWSATGAGLAIRGNWNANKKVVFVRIRQSGTFDMTASGISFSISLRMGTYQGKPTIQMGQCTSRIGSLSINIRGSWLANLFKGAITRALRRAAEQQRAPKFTPPPLVSILKMCEEAKKVITTTLNPQLAQLNVLATIDNKFVFDFSLLRAPTFGPGYVQTMQRGEVRARTNPVYFPGSPGYLPPPSGPTKMVYIWGSDYVINSFAYAAFRMGLAQYTISSNDLPANQRRLLQTSCSGSTICLGSLFPVVATTFPNRRVNLVMRAVSAPSIATTPRGITLTLPGEVSVNAISSAGRSNPILRIRLTLRVSVNVRLEDRFVKGSVTNFRPTFTVLQSIIPGISTRSLQNIFNMALQPVLLTKLNELGSGGIEVPNLRQIRFIRPVVKLNNGNVMFGTDIDWQSLVPPTIRPPIRATARPPILPPWRGCRGCAIP